MAEHECRWRMFTNVAGRLVEQCEHGRARRPRRMTWSEMFSQFYDCELADALPPTSRLFMRLSRV